MPSRTADRTWGPVSRHREAVVGSRVSLAMLAGQARELKTVACSVSQNGSQRVFQVTVKGRKGLLLEQTQSGRPRGR